MKRPIIYLILLAGLGFASCKKYLDVNTNPNEPTSAPLNGLLGQATEQTALNVFRVANITGYYVQYLSSSNPASPSDTYEPIDASSTWTNLYAAMTDIYDMINQAEAAGATHHAGVGKILMAMNLKMVTDLWGDAPYSTAFDAETFTPSYDNAQELYNRCLQLLDEGVVLLDATDVSADLDPSMDFIHKGKLDAWKKTAAVLKARWLNLLSKSSGYNATAILDALDNGYTSRADDAQVTVFNNNSPWGQVALNNEALLLDGWLSDQVINAFNGNTYGLFDARIQMITDTTKYGNYIGTRNGIGRKGSGIEYEECYLVSDKYYSNPESPLILVSYEEAKFIESEAAFRSGDMDRAYNAYLEGINANFSRLGVSTSEKDAYIGDPSVSVGSANLTIDLIMKEKYKANFLNPETWNDARRYDYGYEGFQLPANAVIGNYIRRLEYPSVETSRNSANVPSVSGVDEKLWWDQ